jgi:hypothetical protein
MDLPMAHLLRSTSLLTLLATTACQAGMGPSVQPGVTAPHHVSAGDHVSAELDATADKNAELEARYRLAIEAFDKGAYDDAAAQFAQMLVHVPQDVGGDALRHLLIQHVGWSLLGSYDMSGDSSKLDSGEAILDRYLVKHEQLRPTATDERVEIYELLGEYSLRRDDKPPTNANAHLQALVRETHANLQRPAPSKHAPNEDRRVREIEVDTIRWGSLDDPQVQAYLRDLRYTGISMFELDKPYNHTRVLVRGWVGQPQQAGEPASQRSYDILRLARPTLERCYEEALGRGADSRQPALDLCDRSLARGGRGGHDRGRRHRRHPRRASPDLLRATSTLARSNPCRRQPAGAARRRLDRALCTWPNALLVHAPTLGMAHASVGV